MTKDSDKDYPSRPRPGPRTRPSKPRTKYWRLKAKDRTKDCQIVLKDKDQGPRPRTTSLVITLQTVR